MSIDRLIESWKEGFYERLLSIEPALTQRLKKLLSNPESSKAAENAS